MFWSVFPKNQINKSAKVSDEKKPLFSKNIVFETSGGDRNRPSFSFRNRDWDKLEIPIGGEERNQPDL